MKSIIKHFTLFLLLLSLSITQISVVNATGLSSQTASTPKEGTDDPLAITAKAAVLIENNSGRILYQKNKDKELIPASITKIMTLLLIFDAIDQKKLSLNDSVSVSEYAAKMGGSQVFLESGETQTVQTMIKCISIASANDAAVAIAERIGGSEQAFVKMMNTKAKQLGMKHTHFKNCNGLDEEGHLTTARDVALMSAELIKHKKIFDYTCTWIDYVRDGDTQLVNTNKLIRSYKGITGLKTGTTSQAGSCITATAERNGLKLVAVVLGCDTTQHRFSDAAALLDYGYANWAVITPEVPELPQLSVKNGLSPSVSLKASLPESVLVEKGTVSELKAEITVEEFVEAPVVEGETMGTIRFTTPEGQELTTVPIEAAESVAKLDFGACFRILFQSLLSM